MAMRIIDSICLIEMCIPPYFLLALRISLKKVFMISWLLSDSFGWHFSRAYFMYCLSLVC